MRWGKPQKRKVTRQPNYEYPYPDDGGFHRPSINYVCFECRFNCRRSTRLSNEPPVCPHCQRQMVNVFVKTEIPRKTNDRGWTLLARKFRHKGTKP